CRVFAPDVMGGDPGCPEPLLPPLTQLGRIGRGLDLAQYLKDCGAISVGEYVKRYGVGQRTAMKALNNSPDAISISGKPAKKKMDNYASFHEDVSRIFKVLLDIPLLAFHLLPMSRSQNGLKGLPM
ncbi:MAG: hypothetical protein HWN70_13250, partial [Desulfobacterales bacterium]|nr:hypothetical protein [Desulfobacterales bacterium]